MFALSFLSFGLSVGHAESLINRPEAKWNIQPVYELGFIGVLQNDIQLGKNGTGFDYISEGGEDNLFRYARYEMNFVYQDTHNLSFLFQPFDVTTSSVLRSDKQFDSVLFAQGTPMFYRYGFDYYRATYSKNFIYTDKKRLSGGVAMQIRNATLDFRSQDGELQNSSRDIGPVPLATISGEMNAKNHVWYGFEATGSFAPIKYINGSNSDIVGALLDASIRGGLHLKNKTDVYVNLRYIGGGAEGTDSTPDPGKDGYVANWIQLTSLSVGFRLR